MASKVVQFGPLTIPLSQVFLLSKHTYGLVNLKPIRPGHVLVVSRRKVARFNDLTLEEVTDLFTNGQRISKAVEKLFNADGLTLCVQDGDVAGQTVKHVHLHVIPRNTGDFANNDDIYSVLEGTGNVPQQTHVDNDQRVARTATDMAAEAKMLRRQVGGWDDAVGQFIRYKLTDQSDMQQIDTQVGTVSPHRHHLVVCNSSPEKWPSRIEGMSETVTALARGSIRLPGRAMVTMSDFAPLNSNVCGCASQNTKDDKFQLIDVAVFPLGLVAKQLDVAGVNKLLEWLSYDILPTSWTPTHANLPQPEFDHSWLELTQNRHIFVCTHGSRDYLCGLHGGKLLNDLRSLIEQRNLQKHIGAWATSHIGGHKYAANAIVYPRGDWYGTWCDKCNTSTEPERRDDAQAIMDAVVHDVTWWDAWRGATNMSKQDQIAMWTRSADHADNAGHAESDEFSWVPATRQRSAFK
ncbi:Dinucleoside triphosphate hydrolase [Coemansia sp. RSA 1878]|nr:Dinucleoside triphosphate hydrolase [Coemansia sp. RSA 1878]